MYIFSSHKSDFANGERVSVCGFVDKFHCDRILHLMQALNGFFFHFEYKKDTYDLRATMERKTHYRNDGHEMTKQKKNEQTTETPLSNLTALNMWCGIWIDTKCTRLRARHSSSYTHRQQQNGWLNALGYLSIPYTVFIAWIWHESEQQQKKKHQLENSGKQKIEIKMKENGRQQNDREKKKRRSELSLFPPISPWKHANFVRTEKNRSLEIAREK